MEKKLFHPKVSVMIITYNQEHLIKKTIDSVLSQNYSNLEIIVSDDASTDTTPDIIQEYFKNYPNIIVPILNTNNLGITGNSNKAFKACTGELVAILGGDDTFLPDKIKKQVKVFKDQNVVLSYHPVDVFLDSNNKTLFVTNKTEKERINNVYDIITKGGIPGASSIMVRFSACPEHGFAPEFPTVSDWIFSIETAYHGKVVEVPEVLGRYRKHGSGASEKTYELLNESLMTLTTIQNKYPNDDKIKKACSIGRYRYLCGELFRQIKSNNYALSKEIANLINENVPISKKNQWVFISLLLSNIHCFKLASMILPKIKNFIKRMA